MHLIYLHGFASSSASFKAQLIKDFINQSAEHSVFLADLPIDPNQAVAMIEDHIQSLEKEDWAMVGSSLGGFYATYLCEKYQKKGVLINPAVKAQVLLTARLGDNVNYQTGQRFNLTPEHIKQLEGIYLPNLKYPQNFLLLTQTADEVLDYKEGVEYYEGCEQIIIKGGNHGFDDYENYLDKTLAFLSR